MMEVESVEPETAFNMDANEPVEDPQEDFESLIMANHSSRFSEDSIVVGVQPAATPPPPPLPTRRRPISKVSAHRDSGELCVPRDHMDMMDTLFFEGYRSDVSICTEDGGVIAAHSLILAAASPVMRGILDDTVSWPRSIAINGVPYSAAKVFIRYLYSSRYEQQAMKEFVMHLFVLAHSYCVPSLKRTCSHNLQQGLLTNDNVVDVLLMARLCDAPRLHLLCYRIVMKSFKEVAKTEGWRVMCASNPELEQELVEAVIETTNRNQERAKKVEENKVYEQLHDAMEALVHICRDGCKTIGPHDKAFDLSRQGACKYPACKGLESLVRHFASCKLKVSGGCVHCKRMCQLLELHSQICQEPFCKVPLCGHLKKKMELRHRQRYEQCWEKVQKAVSAKKAASAFCMTGLMANLDRIA
jgi:hypothetical protein